MDPFFIDVQPREADTFVGYSTTPGKVSPIHSFNGTAFFQVLASCLQKNYKRAPLDHIYTMVTDIVATKWHTKKSSKFRHIPQKISTLRGTLYFTENPYVMVGSQSNCYRVLKTCTILNVLRWSYRFFMFMFSKSQKPLLIRSFYKTGMALISFKALHYCRTLLFYYV